MTPLENAVPASIILIMMPNLHHYRLVVSIIIKKQGQKRPLDTQKRML